MIERPKSSRPFTASGTYAPSMHRMIGVGTWRIVTRSGFQATTGTL